MATGEVKDGGSHKIDFPHFDILSGNSGYSDHYYYVEIADLIGSKKCISNKIAKEWKVLEESLPESIFVRTYEDRMDLLRAVIIGSHGTPYHDGLFFFDIVLPSDYPTNPPKVHYHSHGMRLNPNLYNSGYVCLSLINTWFGRGVEVWRPGDSTILQILVSLQGIVLGDKPFFNEPGWGIQLNDLKDNVKKASTTYNEGVFVSSCKTMLCKIRHPPKGFESFVVEHFCGRRAFILAAIMAYASGEAVVGEYKEAGGSSSVSSSSSIEVSEKFRSDLMQIHSDLKSEFVKMAIERFMEFRIEARRDENALPSVPEGSMQQLQSRKVVENYSKGTTAITSLDHKKGVENQKKKFYNKIIKVLKCGFY